MCVGSAAVLANGASVALAQPANDGCAAATAISGATTVTFDTAGATTDGPVEASCLFFGSNQIFNDVWYCWTAASTGTMRVSTCTFTALDTKIAVYAGCVCPDGSVGPIACVDDACGTQTQVDFNATAGQAYMIRLGSFGAAATGAGTMSIAPPPPPGTVAGPIVNPANNHTYYLLTPSSWTTAETNAVTLGGHLITVNDSAENEFARASVLRFDGADRRGWIGYNDVASEGTFVWSSGQTSTYTNWSGGEPNNSGGLEDWAEMFGNGQWNDNSDAPTGLAVYGIVEIEVARCVADYDDGSGTGTPDGGVTLDDLLYFLDLYGAGDVRADVDDGSSTNTHDGGVTLDDLLYFLLRYDAGC
jgi:hypothetical protein